MKIATVPNWHPLSSSCSKTAGHVGPPRPHSGALEQGWLHTPQSSTMYIRILQSRRVHTLLRLPPLHPRNRQGPGTGGHSRFIHVHTCVYRNKSAHMQSGNHCIDAFGCHRLCSLERRPRCFPCTCLSSAPGSPEAIHLSVGKPGSKRSQGSSIISPRSCFMTTPHQPRVRRA